jgi:hypothetical protein
VVGVGVRHPTEVVLGDEYNERVSGAALVRHREAETFCSARRLAESRQGGISPRCLPSLERRNVNARQRGRVGHINGDKRPATPERHGDTWDGGDGMKTEQSGRMIERRFDLSCSRGLDCGLAACPVAITRHAATVPTMKGLTIHSPLSPIPPQRDTPGVTYPLAGGPHRPARSGPPRVTPGSTWP